MQKRAAKAIIIDMVSYDKKDRYALEKDTMLQIHLKGRDITDPAVLDAIAQVPREEFIPEKYKPNAYEDRPLPIGTGQTISQPYIVALMTQCLQLTKNMQVLEIGTGSGYQTAILAKLAKKVYTIERHNQLTEAAQAALGRLGIQNVEYFIGDGSKGWPEKKIFDRAMITAAVPSPPQLIVDQLCENGLLVAPVGGPFTQDLIVYEKKQSSLSAKTVCGCRFVKLIGDHGFTENQ